MKMLFTIVVVLFLGIKGIAQENNSIPLIGSDAPTFTANTTLGELNFPGDYGIKWKILFSHPKDFTPVCSSEVLELAQMQEQFDNLNTRIVVLSVDQVDEHKSWIHELDRLNYKDRTPKAIKFALVDDNNLSISKKYGMLHNPAGTERDVRGVFIVDPKNKVRAMFFYPMEIGRNLAEIERTLIALQTYDKQGVLTPANWKPGEDVFLPYVDDVTKKSPGVYEISWFMIGKKL
jgi:peroxiredoxin (alkyl hydroperoxide reductase subunit C)